MVAKALLIDLAEGRLARRGRRMSLSCMQIELSREPLHVLTRVRDARSAL
jgi:hypothetical protein